MTKKKHLQNKSAVLCLLAFVGLSLFARWQIVSNGYVRGLKQLPHNIFIPSLEPQHTCQLRRSIPDDIASAFSDIAAVGRFQAPKRTDDHTTEHLRRKDANEQAINSVFASLQANLSSTWEAGLLPLLDSGCSTIHLNTIQDYYVPSTATTKTGVYEQSSMGKYSWMQQAGRWQQQQQQLSQQQQQQQQQQQRRSSKRTAILLVSDQRSRLQLHLQSYAVQLATLWYYATAFNYALEIYTHNETLPANVTGHFVKIKGVQKMFKLGYDYVLGMDWDMYITPFTAAPLSLFFSEWPNASVLLQGEHNLCTGAVLYRNTPAAVQVLQHWWELALTGCCWRGPLHDQVAFKHMLQDYLANFTGDGSFYPAEEQAKLPRNRSPQTTRPTQLLAMRQQLQASSDFGFVGLEMAMEDKQRNIPRIGLHSCHGLFWGCIPDDAPALLMHTGHKRTHLAWVQHRMLLALYRWIMLAAENADQAFPV